MALSGPKGRKRRGFKFYLGLVAAFSLFWVLLCVLLAQGPDRDLRFVREVPVEVSPQAVNLSLWTLSNWHKWFFSMASVQRVDLQGLPLPLSEQNLVAGAHLLFHVDPKKGKHRRFDLLVVVTQYVPGSRVDLRILSDSSGRLTRLFDPLEWHLALLPPNGATPLRVEGVQTVRTHHWRSRLFAALSERILMNQIFYPDLLKLAKPQPVDLSGDK
jgi:hypothetical protein